jgi:signal transduction histidine kinase
MSDRIAELEAKLESVRNTKEKIDLMNDLALELRFNDLQRASILSQTALELADQGFIKDQPYRTGKAKSLQNLGIFQSQLGFFDEALSLWEKSLLLYQLTGQYIEIAEVLNSCGKVYIYKGDYPNALAHHQRALNIAKEIGAKEIESISLNNLGFLYTQLGEYEKALQYLHQSLDMAEDLGNIREQADAFANCCACYFQLSNYSNALKFGKKSLELYRKIGARQGEADVNNLLGVVYQAQENYDEALNQNLLSMQISSEIGDRVGVIRILRTISFNYMQQGFTEPAITNLKHALAAAEEIHSKREQVYSHQALADIYKKTGNPDLAMLHNEQYNTLKETISEAVKHLESQEAIHQTETASKDVEAIQLKNIALQQEVSEHRQAEQALHIANEQLKNEINMHEDVIADLNAFSRMVAHDLKNPLTGLIGYASLLSKKFEDSTDIQALRYLEIITQTSFRINRIIEELLLLANVSKKAVEMVPLDMAAIVDEVIARLEYMISQNSAEIIKPSTWPTAIGYGPWVEELWANYISNAIKYGGIPPIITLGADVLPKGIIRFWVLDNGDGIIPDDQKKLFSPFTRLEDARSEGHGLGLSIVKRIIEKLGGTADVESKALPGEGSKFSFTLPISRNESKGVSA